MVKSKFGITFDNLIICLIVFVLTYLWSYRLVKVQFFSLALSILIASVVFVFIQKYFLKRYRKLKLTAKEQKQFDDTLKTLSIFTEHENSVYFENLLEVNRISKNIYENEKCYFYINFSQKLSSFDYFYVNNFYLENQKTKPIVFLSNGTTAEFNELIKECNFEFRLFSANDLFEIIRQKQYFPQSSTKLISNKSISRIVRIKNVLKATISRARFREFFFSGLSFLFLSVIVPFSLYYLIAGTVFLIISLLCLIIKKEPKPIKKDNQALIDFC